MPNTLTNKAAHLKKAALDKAKKTKRNVEKKYGDIKEKGKELKEDIKKKMK